MLTNPEDGIETAAMSFVLSVHSRIDSRMDRITGGKTERFGDDKRTDG